MRAFFRLIGNYLGHRIIATNPAKEVIRSANLLTERISCPEKAQSGRPFTNPRNLINETGKVILVEEFVRGFVAAHGFDPDKHSPKIEYLPGLVMPMVGAGYKPSRHSLRLGFFPDLKECLHEFHHVVNQLTIYKILKGLSQEERNNLLIDTVKKKTQIGLDEYPFVLTIHERFGNFADRPPLFVDGMRIEMGDLVEEYLKMSPPLVDKVPLSERRARYLEDMKPLEPKIHALVSRHPSYLRNYITEEMATGAIRDYLMSRKELFGYIIRSLEEDTPKSLIESMPDINEEERKELIKSELVPYVAATEVATMESSLKRRQAEAKYVIDVATHRKITLADQSSLQQFIDELEKDYNESFRYVRGLSLAEIKLLADIELPILNYVGCYDECLTQIRTLADMKELGIPVSDDEIKLEQLRFSMVERVRKIREGNIARTFRALADVVRSSREGTFSSKAQYRRSWQRDTKRMHSAIQEVSELSREYDTLKFLNLNSSDSIYNRSLLLKHIPEAFGDLAPDIFQLT